MWKWVKRVFFTIAMLFVCFCSGSLFFVGDSDVKSVANIIISIVIILMGIGGIILYFKSEGEGSTLLTVIMILQGVLMIVPCILGYAFEGLGFIGWFIALWVHHPDSLFSFIKEVLATLGGRQTSLRAKLLRIAFAAGVICGLVFVILELVPHK